MLNKDAIIKQGKYSALYGAEERMCPYWPSTLAAMWWRVGYKRIITITGAYY